MAFQQFNDQIDRVAGQFRLVPCTLTKISTSGRRARSRPRDRCRWRTLAGHLDLAAEPRTSAMISA